MICSRPFKIRHPKFSYGLKTVEEVLEVPCGRCIACKIQHSREWAQRILHEVETSPRGAIFTTLTYSDYVGPLVFKDLTDFWKRLRKRLNAPIKYFACGEYGEKNGRPHFHAIVFNLPVGSEWNNELQCFYSPDKVIETAWGHGLVFNGTVTYDSARYVAGYILKQPSKKLDLGGFTPPSLRVSRGIGLDYLNSHFGQVFNGLYVNGVRTSLPRYYLKKRPELMESYSPFHLQKDTFEQDAREYYLSIGSPSTSFASWFDFSNDDQRMEIVNFQAQKALNAFNSKLAYDNAQFSLFDKRL